MVVERIKKIQSFVTQENLAGLLVDDTVDLFYLTSLKLSLGRLLITPQSATLFVDGRYLESAKKMASCEVASLAGFEGHVKEIRGKIGFDAFTTIYKSLLDLQKLGLDLEALEGPVKKLREVKDAQELQLLQKAADLGSRGYDHVLNLLKEGISEEEIAKELEIFWLRAGGEKVAFEPIIAFGENSSQPHYRAGKRRLKKGDTVLIDIGVMLEGYASDMTRVLFFGKPSPKMEEIYDAVREAHTQAVQACNLGVSMKQIEKRAREVIASRGFGEYFPHSLGHGVGLEVHEWPSFKSEALLKEGMVFTIEPGIYLPSVGGVRLEDTVVATPTGVKSLTNITISISPLVI